MASAYQEEYESKRSARINRLWDDMQHMLSEAEYGDTASIRKANREAVLPVVEELYVAGELDENDELLSKYIEKAVKNKNSAAARHKAGSTELQQSLHLPNKYSFRVKFVQSEHKILRLEQGYSGETMVPKREIEVVCQWESLKAVAALAAKLDPSAKGMTEAELVHSAEIGERRAYEVKIGLGMKHGTHILLVCSCETETIHCYFYLDKKEMADNAFSSKAVCGDMQEAVQKLVDMGPSPDYALEFHEVDYQEVNKAGAGKGQVQGRK